MATQRFKKNDFVFCDFKLQQIVGMEGPNITEVADGHFRMSSNSLNDRCYEVTLRNKIISECFDGLSDKLHALRNSGLNYPDMHRYLVGKWCDACFTKDKDLSASIMDSTTAWVESIRSYVEEECKNKAIDGVLVFRP